MRGRVRQDVVRMRQDGVTMRQDASGRRQEWFTYAAGSVRVASGWRQDGVRKV